MATLKQILIDRGIPVSENTGIVTESSNQPGDVMGKCLTNGGEVIYQKVAQLKTRQLSRRPRRISRLKGESSYFPHR